MKTREALTFLSVLRNKIPVGTRDDIRQTHPNPWRPFRARVGQIYEIRRPFRARVVKIVEMNARHALKHLTFCNGFTTKIKMIFVRQFYVFATLMSGKSTKIDDDSVREWRKSTKIDDDSVREWRKSTKIEIPYESGANLLKSKTIPCESGANLQNDNARSPYVFNGSKNENARSPYVFNGFQPKMTISLRSGASFWTKTTTKGRATHGRDPPAL